MTAVLLAILLAAPDLRVLPPPITLQFSTREIASERNTRIALVSTAVLLLALEYVIVRERADGHITPTISQVMEDWGSRYGTLPWATGVLAGHWFWNDSRGVQRRDARRNALVLGGLTAGVVAWDIVDHSGRTRFRGPLLLLSGVLAGRLLWTQAHR